MDKDFLTRLDRAREYAGVPFHITSGFRCDDYQNILTEQGYQTAKGTSPHQKGVAVDIAWNNESRYQILDSLRKVDFTRFGFAKNYVHVDADVERRKEYIWYYLH